MIKLLCDDARRLAPARNPSQFIPRGIVPKKMRFHPLQFSAVSHAPEPNGATGVSYRGTAHKDKMQVSIRFPANLIPERFQ
jgi:hypothetical protein